MAGNQQEKYSRSPVDTIVEYLWCDSTGAGSFLKKARRLEADVKKSASDSALPGRLGPTIRSVGIIPLGEGRGLEQQLLAPAIVYQVLVDWLGNPSAASSIASTVGDRIARRIGLTPQYVMGSVVNSVSSREEDEDRKIVPQRLRAARTDGSLDFIAGGLSNQLHREISIALGDRKYNVAALIESLSVIQKLCSDIPDVWRASLDAEQHDHHQYADEIGQLASESLAKICEECKYLQERMECLAAVLAVSAVTVKQRFGDEDPWKSMPPRTASGKDGIVNLVHQATVNTHLVRPLNDVDSNLDPESLIDHLSEVAMPYLVSWLSQNADEFETGLESPTYCQTAGTYATQDLGNTMSIEATILPPMATAVDATQQIAGSDSTGTDTAVLSVQDAVAIVRPQLMEFGGSQRLILMVGNATERSQFESKIRESHQGSLTVKVVDEKEPMLIHEAQGISLDAILARLEVLNGETAAITGRLSSRIDVQW